MKVYVETWDNNAPVCVPARAMSAAALSLDHVADVREEAGRAVIEPIQNGSFVLDDLVAGITDANRHDRVDTGPSVGRALW
jgi:antitoxin MazE